jgi:single-stranded DNA-binding protein
MTEAAVSFAGNLTDDPEVRYTHDGSPGTWSDLAHIS